jgi:hypothetical protein
LSVDKNLRLRFETLVSQSQFSIRFDSPASAGSFTRGEKKEKKTAPSHTCFRGMEEGAIEEGGFFVFSLKEESVEGRAPISRVERECCLCMRCRPSRGDPNYGSRFGTTVHAPCSP